MKTEPKPIYVPNESLLWTGSFTVEPARTMQADGYPWEHEIRLALPQSYADSTRSYPVLWVTDNNLETALPALGGAELIIVSIGAPRSAGGPYSTRRAYDFYPCEDINPGEPHRQILRRKQEEWKHEPVKGGGAARFLDFLIDDVRPALAAEYRMNADEHGLEGYSAGGWFVVYALLERPGAFARYLAGAPALYYCDNLIWDIEERYAAEHDDLPGHLYFGIGDGEMTTDNHFGCFSSTAKMVEVLTFRGYPSLQMDVKIFLGESHGTALPAIMGAGARALWGEKIAPLPPA